MLRLSMIAVIPFKNQLPARNVLEALMIAVTFHRSQVRLGRQLIDRVSSAAQLLAAHRHAVDLPLS